MTYEEVLAEAEQLYKKVAEYSPFVAMFKCRAFIASKIDLCSDRNEHLDVLKWDEYKENYAPMTRKEYEDKLCLAKESYNKRLAAIEKEWQERGKNSPDYHKI